MGIEQKVRNKDNVLQLKSTLSRMNLPQYLIDNSIEVLERNYAKLKKDINGRYYSGCCV